MNAGEHDNFRRFFQNPHKVEKSHRCNHTNCYYYYYLGDFIYTRNPTQNFIL